MNVVDIAIVLILAITILGGWYRGFVSAALGVMATLLAWLIGVACMFLGVLIAIVTFIALA